MANFPPVQIQSTSSICGPFDPPAVTDEGQCFPLRTKRSCDAPVLPVIQCSDDQYATVFDPTTGAFRVLSRIFDQNCLPILDQDNQPITGFYI